MAFSDFWKSYHQNGIIPNLWKGITGQLSNELIADENLDYQRDRNAIEDSRYFDETSYNRAFAEDERDYNRAFAEDERQYNRAFAEEQRDYERALQQQIFEREDTAIQRQADALSSIGINPLSQNIQGLGSGSVVSSSGYGGSSAPSSLGVPSASSRGGQALYNDMKYQGIQDIFGYISGIANSVNQYKTGNLNRDALALQNDAQFLKNMKDAHDLGIDYNGIFSGSSIGWRKLKDKNWEQYFYDNSTGERLFHTDKWKKTADSYFFNKGFEVRDIKHKINNGYYSTDSDKIRFLKDLSSDDFPNMLEKLLTKAVDITSNISSNFNNGKPWSKIDLFQNFINKLF